MNGTGFFGGKKGVDNGRGRKKWGGYFVDTLGTCREAIYLFRLEVFFPPPLCGRI